jgi:hypothetical protein
MDDTEPRLQHKKTFVRRRRATIIGMVLMIPFGFLSGFGIAAGAEAMDILGIPPAIWLPICLVLFCSSIVLCAVNWRCPACGAGLPIYANPLRCQVCGAHLR